MDGNDGVARGRSSAANRPVPELSREQWARVKEVFHAAVERPPDERPAFVHDRCGDPALSSAVAWLLAGDAAARSFMETPAGALVGLPAALERGALTIGQRFGAYTVVASIGVGGMGEVYRARDSKLGRDVAVKVLPASLASHPERLARFDREARLLATLSHPNIATIHGIEDVAADAGSHVRAIVMELVDGETLAERLRRGPIPLAEAVAIARQIASALDAAHEKAIVHRDLKPANIAITRDDVVKVLDFGLAKPASGDGATADLTQSPTMTFGGTEEGIILGTAAYMSPEQARGRAVDKRADIWAFGCVLYEMLTGRAAFAGETVSDTIAKILQTEPEWPAAVRDAPHVWRLLTRCLEKDPKRRLRDIGEAIFRLEHGDDVAPSATARHTRNRLRLAWASTAVLAGVVAGLLVILATKEAPETPLPSETRTTFVLASGDTLDAGTTELPLAVSRDALRVAYVAERNGRTRLYYRDLNDLIPKELPGTEGARHPFWSYDGKSVAFFANDALQAVDIAGGAAPRRLSVVKPRSSLGGSWGKDGTIVFATAGGGLRRLDKGVGTPQPLGDTDGAMWPQILPDDKRVLFSLGDRFAVVPLAGGPAHVVARQPSRRVQDSAAVLGPGGGLLQARYLDEGYLMYGQSPGIVQLIRFDLASLTISGSPVSIVDGVERGRRGGGVYFDVSPTGVLVYAPTGRRHQLAWVDQKGMSTTIGDVRAAIRSPRLSPDESRIVASISDDARRDSLWLFDARSGTPRPLGSDNDFGLSPKWNPDGLHVIFARGAAIVEAPVSGGPAKVLVPPGKRFAYPVAMSASGDLLYIRDTDTVYNLWKAPRAPGNAAGALQLPGEDDAPWIANGSGADLSHLTTHNGLWVTYEQWESGGVEIYIAPFRDPANKIRISDSTGTRPIWSHDDRKVFYRRGEDMMAVDITWGAKVTGGAPQLLFSGNYSGEGHEPAFDVAKDGRFLMVKGDDAATLRQLHLWQNWLPELKRRLAARAQ